MAPTITRPNDTSRPTNTAFMPTLLFVPPERQIVNINHEFLLTTTHAFVRRVDEVHSSHLGVVGAGSGECPDG